MEATIATLEQGFEWLTAGRRIGWIACMPKAVCSRCTATVWKTLGRCLETGLVETGADEVWLEEVAKALQVAWPLPHTQPGREELIHVSGLAMRR